ncbi:MAG: type II toxin-antitoxin system Phd/YefM family antitoxin [Alphaproteobacteria bacterium]
MDESVTAAEANRRFSHFLRKVRDGGPVIITAHGRPVAKLVPADEEEAARLLSRRRLLARLRRRPAVDIGKWTRDELYEDE